MRPTTPLLHLSAPGATRTHSEFTLDLLLDLKGTTTVSVCIPARDEARTIASVVEPIARTLVPAGLVDELLVLDHGSTDATAAVARRSGATVVPANDVLADFGPALGKGDVLWRSLHASTGDLIVWLDSDLTSFGTHYVTGLLGPLLTDPGISLVRATYDRSLHGTAGEGGRVTELLARPLIATLFPDLEHIRQPLGGEYAVRREAAERVAFEVDYGVEMGLLLDIASSSGVSAIAQVDLGHRAHRNRSLSSLREQSRQVLRAALLRTPMGESIRGNYDSRPPLVEVAQRRPVAG